ncbi:MAG: ptsP [Clostridia bacterium]|jgi:phosphotransferase system enzyme I (PtsI)|nr:ptsP [Clostridia bacterium]
MRGVGASSGIAMGEVFIKASAAKVEKAYTKDVEGEPSRLAAAIEQSREQLDTVIQTTKSKVGVEEAQIFEAHKLMLEDPELVDRTKEKIKIEKVQAHWAVQETVQELLKIFDGIDDEYIKERAADLKDVSERLIDNLLGVNGFNLDSITRPVIIAAKELTPSDMTKLPEGMVLGIITEAGGAVSHTAIISRVMGIPAIVAAEGLMKSVSSGDLLAMDGGKGEYFVNPEADVVRCYEQKISEQQERRKNLQQYIGKRSVTIDGFEISIGCNIGNPRDVDAVLQNDGAGIGLFRSEFLYMERSSLPTEEEQFQAYKQVAEKMNPKPVIIRSLDIGGDKQIPYMDFPKEENPFLGYRAIRYCLEEREIFRTQLRAMLRASAYGKVKIMLPMISTVEEVRAARQELYKAMAELRSDELPFDESIEMGIMIETPAAAVITDKLAEEADFFSIGTNDLTQYTLAVDRMNSKVAMLYSTYHPAVLRLIKLIIDSAKRADVWVGMCGEAAQDERLIPVLLGMGLDELSVSPPQVLKVRKQISCLDKREMEHQVKTILDQSSAADVLKYIGSLSNEK